MKKRDAAPLIACHLNLTSSLTGLAGARGQFERDEVSEHMLVLSTGWLKGKSFLRSATVQMLISQGQELISQGQELPQISNRTEGGSRPGKGRSFSGRDGPARGAPRFSPLGECLWEGVVGPLWGVVGRVDLRL